MQVSICIIHLHLIIDDIQRQQKHIIMFTFQHLTITKTIHKRLEGKKEKEKKVVETVMLVWLALWSLLMPCQ